MTTPQTLQTRKRKAIPVSRKQIESTHRRSATTTAGAISGETPIPTLIVWGKNDEIFPAEGAYPYKRDLMNLEFHLLDTGHFALEEDGQVIADHIRRFLNMNVKRGSHGRG